MKVRWETRPANVQTVQARIPRIQGRELAYTTVQTMLNVLHRKGKVIRRLKEPASLDRPVLSRQNTVTKAVGDMLDLNLVETRHLTPEKVARIQKLLKRAN